MPFLISSDKTVVNAIQQAAWSPGKDLIACLTLDSQLHAYREFPSFQRIWAVSFQSEPTSMCWRPDGIRLAVGHDDGSVSMIDAENGNTEMKVILKVELKSPRMPHHLRTEDFVIGSDENASPADCLSDLGHR
jgi:WD40 repeat protein